MANYQEEIKSDDQTQLSNSKFESRYYKRKFPKVGDYVKVKVNKIGDSGAYVSLVEYNNIEGFIPIVEFSSLKLMNVNKALKEGKEETAVVLNCDENKGCIDLSKKRVDADKLKKFEERFSKAKTVHLILRSVAEKMNMDFESLQKATAWELQLHLASLDIKSVYDAFRCSIVDPAKVWSYVKIPEDVLKALEVEILRRLGPSEVKVRADFEITCDTADGINAIKLAIVQGEKCHQEKPELKFQVISAPLYVVVVYTIYPSEAKEKITKALKDVEAAIKGFGGTFKLLEAPRVVGDKGDNDIKLLLSSIEKKQKEKEPGCGCDDSSCSCSESENSSDAD